MHWQEHDTSQAVRRHNGRQGQLPRTSTYACACRAASSPPPPPRPPSHPRFAPLLCPIAGTLDFVFAIRLWHGADFHEQYLQPNLFASEQEDNDVDEVAQNSAQSSPEPSPGWQPKSSHEFLAGASPIKSLPGTPKQKKPISYAATTPPPPAPARRLPRPSQVH